LTAQQAYKQLVSNPNLSYGLIYNWVRQRMLSVKEFKELFKMLDKKEPSENIEIARTQEYQFDYKTFSIHYDRTHGMWWGSIYEEEENEHVFYSEKDNEWNSEEFQLLEKQGFSESEFKRLKSFLEVNRQ